MCTQMGCEYEECVEEEIRKQLLQILYNGMPGSDIDIESDEIWRMKMENIITQQKDANINSNQQS